MRWGRVVIAGLIILLAAQLGAALYLSHDKIVAYGLFCTCPDVEIIRGRALLNSLVPENLQPLYTGEAYLTGNPRVTTISFDGRRPTHPYYVFSGRVTGKARVSEHDPWNPVIEMETLYLITDEDIMFLQLLLGLEGLTLAVIIAVRVGLKIKKRFSAKKLGPEIFS